MKATMIDWGLGLFGMRGKLSGYHSKFGIASSALVVIAGLLTALAKALQVAIEGHYGTAVLTFLDSEEFKLAAGLFAATKMYAGGVLKQDKTIAIQLATASGEHGLAQDVAVGAVSPAAVIATNNPPPDGLPRTGI